MNASRIFSRLCLFLLLLGLAASVLIAIQRSKIEAANRTVEIVVDYDEAVLLAEQRGVSTPDCLRMLKEAGVTSVSVNERTLESLAQSGRLVPIPVSGPGETRFYVPLPGPPWDITFGSYLQAKMKGVRLNVPESSRTLDIPHFAMASPTKAVWETGLGFDPEALQEITQAGLLPIARPSNDVLVSPAYLRLLFSDLSRSGVKSVIFEGKVVLGFPGLLKEVANDLSEGGLTYCWVEFAEQTGAEKLAKSLSYHLLRLHSISQDEMLRLKPDDALDRLLRAAKERGIRLLYVHLPLNPSSDPQSEPLAFVKTLAGDLQKDGFHLGRVELLPDYSPSFPLVLLVLLGICASPFVLLRLWGLGSARLLLILLLLFFLGASALLVVADGLARPLLALLAAVVFPILSVTVFFPRAAPRATPRFAPALAYSVLKLIGCVAVSLTGGLLVAAILSKSSYFVGAQLFRGIKFAQAFPLVVIFLLVIGQNNGESRVAPSQSAFRRFLGLTVEMRHLLGLFLLLGFAVFWIARTGNQPGVGTSPLEMKMRDFLEATLGARPRSKEFLLGHPLLLLGFLTYALALTPAWRNWAAAFILIGSIGLTSVVNTFCHLHSPLYLGLWRTFNGLWLGCLIGILLAVLLFRRRRPLPTDHSPP